MTITKAELLEAYRIMKTIREFEERVHIEFASGEIPGFVHLYAGEEASATGICLLATEECTDDRTARYGYRYDGCLRSAGGKR